MYLKSDTIKATFGEDGEEKIFGEDGEGKIFGEDGEEKILHFIRNHLIPQVQSYCFYDCVEND